MLSEATFVTLTTDAWSNLRNESVINYCVIDNNRQVLLLSADAPGEMRHTGLNLAEHAEKNALSVLAQHSVEGLGINPAGGILGAIVTDSASNCKLMRQLLVEVCQPCLPS
jgi:hypothetical protein